MSLVCGILSLDSNVPDTPLVLPECEVCGTKYYDIAQFYFARCQVYQTPFNLGSDAVVIGCASSDVIEYVVCHL